MSDVELCAGNSTLDTAQACLDNSSLDSGYSLSMCMQLISYSPREYSLSVLHRFRPIEVLAS